MNDFEGDVLFTDSMDCGVITVEDGEVKADKGFLTAGYLSLLGGEESWWGNKLNGTKQAEKFQTRFLDFIAKNPMTSKNIFAAEDLIRSDFDWFLKEGIADEIQVAIRALDSSRIKVEIAVLKNNETLEDSIFNLNWGEMKNGI